MLPLVVVITVGMVEPILATAAPGCGPWKQANAQSPGAEVSSVPWAGMPVVSSSFAPEMPRPWLSIVLPTRLLLCV